MSRKLKTISLITISLLILSQSFLAQDKQEIVLTITGLPASDKLDHFNTGEALRKQMNFQEAIKEYRIVITPGEYCDKEPEAHYNIGLCYTWLGELDSASTVFNDVIKTYPANGMAVGYAQYSLAWIEVQRTEFEKAIERLQNILDNKVCEDVEFNAMVLFEIGRIYGAYLNDWEKAHEIFNLVLEQYPGTKVTNHSFITGLK